MKKVKVSAPATVANLVCGFDILGMALNDPNDIMEMTLLDEPVIRIKHADDYDLPLEPAKNVAGAALLALQEACACFGQSMTPGMWDKCRARKRPWAYPRVRGATTQLGGGVNQGTGLSPRARGNRQPKPVTPAISVIRPSV